MRVGPAEVPETQLWFMMLGIRVLQVYGLTETTAICTMDDPNHVEVGRVGPAIPGMEMKLGENDEIVVRGPNIFAGLLEPAGSRRRRPCAMGGFTPAIRAR